MLSTSQERRKFGSRLLAIILLATLALLLVLTIIFQIKKDDIARGILLRVNNIQSGELVFEDISFNPFIHFPNMSVALNDLSYYEKNASFSQNDTIPIVRLNRIYLSFNILKLLQGNVSASQVDLDGGSIHVITYADSTVNLTNAFAILSDTLQNTDEEASGKSTDFRLTLDEISFIDLKISHSNLLDSSHSSYRIHSLDASLSYVSDTIKFTVETALVINNKKIGDKFILQDKPIAINSTFTINKLLNEIIIEPSQFTFGNASFQVHGSIDFTNDGYIDMAIKGYDKDVSAINILLNEQSTKNIKKGEVFFNGTIKGSLYNGIPRVACSFQINDLEIAIPKTEQKISNFNLTGSIDSGTKTDFSEASLIISKLGAILPEGKLSGLIKIHDFSNPELDIDLFLKGDIKGLDRVFNLGQIRGLTGVIELQAQIKGTYDVKKNTLDKAQANARLKFDNVSIELTDTIKLNNINGEIAFRDSVLSLTNFSLAFANSHLQINGSVSNPASFLDIIKSEYSKNSTPQNVLVPGAEFISTYDIDFKLNAHLNDFDRFLPMGITDSLSGVIEVESELRGNFDYVNNTFEKEIENLVFKFDSIYAEHPKAGKIEILNGSLALANSIYSFNELTLKYGKSDFLINGSLNNLHYVFLNVNKEIEGNLHIESKLFAFQDFFSWDKKIANAFPYNIRNINLKVSPSTSTKNLTEFINTPRIEFQINQLDADIEDFLPPVSIKTGHFTLADKDSSLNLDFDNFKAVILDSKISASVIFNAPQTDPNWLIVDAGFLNLNPQETFTYWVSDSLPGYLAGALDGSAHLDLVFSNDSIKFDRLDFIAKNLDFESLSDTININGLRIKAKDIDYQASSGLMQTLSFNTDLSVDKIRSSFLNGDALNYQVETNHGVYQVTTSDSHLFDGDSHGQMTLKPFANPPFYKLNVDAKQFGVAHLLHTFTVDSLLTGKMDLDLNMASTGNNKKEVLENLNGHTAIHGEDLTLTGVDLDKLIDRFKRSQRFTLADVGAIFLMGPAGILVTKGADYTGMVIIDKNTTSKITAFSSILDVNNGIINLTDVAIATNEQRMAAKGWVNLNTDSLEVNIALLNEDGCSIFRQSIKGQIEKPVMGKVHAGKILLAPVSNLAKSVAQVDCEVFYAGHVKHPAKEN